MGTHRSLMEASSFVQAIEGRQGLKIACLEEIAWSNGWIDEGQVRRVPDGMGKTDYAAYLRSILELGTVK